MVSHLQVVVREAVVAMKVQVAAPHPLRGIVRVPGQGPGAQRPVKLLVVRARSRVS
jgi:hypothetical protein